MLAIEMVFPGGRYHATPWNKNVNEGAVEWPPSPWRLLRAIISTWYTKGDGVPEDVMRSVVCKLSTPPEFELPPAALASTCHFMPLYRTPLDEKTANVYDAFAHVGEGALRVVWRDVSLEPKEEEALNILLSRLGYLGRAESWVEARLLDANRVRTNTTFTTESASAEAAVPTLCCMSPPEYESWRENAISALISQKCAEKRAKATSSGKAFKDLTPKERRELEALVPPTLFEALQVDTSELKAAGWSGPPGGKWMNYTLPADAFRVRPTAKARTTPLPTIARYKVRSKVPFTIFDAVLLGELVHDKLVQISDGHSSFTGCDEEGQPLKGDHTMILSHGVASQISGMRITDLTIYNRKGFTPDDEAVLRSLSCLKRSPDGRKDVEAILIGIGDAETFRSEEGVVGPSIRWTSVTPFVPTRCPKSTRTGVPKLDENGLQIGSAEHDLRRLLAAEGYPRVRKIVPVARATVGGSSRSWLAFRRKRISAERKPLNDAGFGFEIEFEEPIDGPLAIGYGRNYGLGLFRPLR